MIKVETKNKNGKIIVNDFTNLGADRGNKINCDKTYNFNVENNLSCNLGIGELKMPSGSTAGAKEIELDYAELEIGRFNKVMYFKQYFPNSGNTTHRLLVHGENKRVYIYQMFYNLTMLTWTYNLEFNSTPIVLEYKKNGLDSILISSDDKLVVWTTNQAPYELTNVPSITSMCIHNDVLYCTIDGENEKIWYTSNLNPESVGTESENTKYITLGDERGACRKILTFKENVYIFRDYGISRLNDYKKDVPTYNQVYLSDSKIYANTVAVCGDVIMFMTKDGIYRFNGATVAKVDCPIVNFLDEVNEHAVSTNMQDKYYLALRVNFDDNNKILCENEEDYKNNALIVMSMQDYSYQIIRGVDIKDMLALKAEFVEKIVLTFNSKNKNNLGEINNSGKYFEDALPKSYSTTYLLQDNDGVTIRKVIVDATKGVGIKLITEDGETEFKTYQDGINEFQTIIQCKKIKMEIATSEDDPKISHVELQYVKRR